MEKFEIVKEWLKGNKTSVISIIISLIIAGSSLVYAYFYKCSECEECVEPIKSNIEEKVVEKEAVDNLSMEIEEKDYLKYIKVDVKGAVVYPGVYTFLEGEVVNNAIIAAGGLTNNAVTSNINLSKKLKDEMVIYVFTKDEMEAKTNTDNIIKEIPECKCEEVTVYKEVCTNPIESITESSDTKKTIEVEESNQDNVSDKKVSINTDSVEELTSLDGIGESKAKQIIDYRKANGDFKNIEDIKNVSGIGEKAYEKIKDKITV